MVLETDRLILRSWVEEDASELYRYAKDPRVAPMAGWPVHTDVENSRQIIRDVLSAPETYAVVLKKTGNPIGSVGIMFGRCEGSTVENHQAEIGYWIGVPYWGRGLIPEAVRELLRHCFEDLHCPAVWCGYYDGNEKSRRVQEKCGFQYHHSQSEVPTLLGDTRTEHMSLLNRQNWLEHKGD